MLLRIHSDLHLEQYLGSDVSRLCEEAIIPDERDAQSFLVLAGDISSNMEQLVKFLRECEKRFKQIIFVPGNHEMYGNDILSWEEEVFLRTVDLENTFICRAQIPWTFHLEDVSFVLGTLWGDGGKHPLDAIKIENGIADFYRISYAGREFTVQDMVNYSKEHKRYIRGDLKVLHNLGCKSVVITHHMPSRSLVSERFISRDGSDGVNGAFVTDCDDILHSDIAPNLWIHGHTHDKIDAVVGNTRVVCNPTGYYGERNKGLNGSIVPYAEPLFVDTDDI